MNEILKQQEEEILQERLSLLLQKRAKIQRSLDLETDAGQQFKYEQEIIEENRKIAQVKENLYGMGATPDPHYAWKKIFDQHQLRDNLEPLVTVNCNREEHYEQILMEHFCESVDTLNNLFYLIVACPYQRPASIAKRLVYEASKDIFIAYATDANRDSAIAVNELGFGLTPEHTWNRFWKSIQNNRNLVDHPPESLSDLAAQLTENRYIALLYRYNAQTWNEKRIEHLRHIAQQFQNMPENNRKFLICIAIEFLQIHDQNCEKYKRELSQLSELCREINANGLLSACVSLLPPVKSESIKSWCAGKLSKDGENAGQRIIEKLKQETQAQEKFNMDQIEPMQEAAYQYSNRNNVDRLF